MRILHVITSLKTGGAEHLMLELLPLLKAAGHDVTLCLFDGSRTPFLEQFERTGIPVVSFSNGGNVYNPLNIVRLWRLMRKGWDIVHTHNTAPQLFAAIGSVLCSVVLCTTEHNTSNRRRDWKWYVSIDRWMYSRYKAIISISPATTENLKDHTNIKCPIFTISNGINVSSFQQALPYGKETLEVGAGKTLLAMVAAFRYQKDQDTLIKAIALLPATYELALIGNGERQTVCEELTKKLRIAERVHFLGVRTDVERILKTADIVVQSSHIDGFCLAAVEGMAAGKPVIASDIPGLAEVVKGAGLLFPHGDAKALADTISSLMKDKKLYNEVADRCLQRAKQYDISVMAEGYVGGYKQIVDQRFLLDRF